MTRENGPHLKQHGMAELTTPFLIRGLRPAMGMLKGSRPSDRDNQYRFGSRSSSHAQERAIRFLGLIRG